MNFSLFNKFFKKKPFKACTACAFFSYGLCVKEKILLKHQPYSGYPEFKKEFVFCVDERSKVSLIGCGRNARFFKQKKDLCNVFEVGDYIKDSTNTVYKVIEAPGTFVVSLSVDVVENMFYILMRGDHWIIVSKNSVEESCTFHHNGI